MKVPNSESSNTFWIDREEERPNSFVVYVQPIWDNAATILKIPEHEILAVPLLLINESVRARLWLIEKSPNLVGIQSMTMENLR